MVIYSGSPAVELRFTAELWINEAFVPAASCHDVFEKCGIVFTRAHMLSYNTLYHPTVSVFCTDANSFITH